MMTSWSRVAGMEHGLLVVSSRSLMVICTNLRCISRRLGDIYRLPAPPEDDVRTWARNRDGQVWREHEVEVGDPVLPGLASCW